MHMHVRRAWGLRSGLWHEIVIGDPGNRADEGSQGLSARNSDLSGESSLGLQLRNSSNVRLENLNLHVDPSGGLAGTGGRT